MKKLFALLLALSLLCVSLLPAGLSEEEQALPPIDLDLTSMSSTFVYSQIFNMMYEPETYIGQVIRIAGWFDVFEDTDTGNVYFSCIVPDAAACCAQGIEFVWAGDHAYPQDYPEPGTEIIVTGRFETYLEDEWVFIHLTDAEVVFPGADV